MPKQFLVTLAFTVEANEEFNSEDSLRYYLRENGYLDFRGEKRDYENNTINVVLLALKSDVALGIHEIDEG